MKFLNGSCVRNFSIICVVLSSLTGCDKLSETSPKIAYVDIAKVMSESSLGKQELEHNQNVKDVLTKAEASAKEKYKTMPSAQQQESSNADATLLNQLWLAEQQHAREISVKAIVDEAETYRASHKLDYVVNSAVVIAADKGNDITQQIIKQLGTKRLNYGDMPKIEVSDTTKKMDKASDLPSISTDLKPVENK